MNPLICFLEAREDAFNGIPSSLVGLYFFRRGGDHSDSSGGSETVPEVRVSGRWGRVSETDSGTSGFLRLPPLCLRSLENTTSLRSSSLLAFSRVRRSLHLLPLRGCEIREALLPMLLKSVGSLQARIRSWRIELSSVSLPGVSSAVACRRQASADARNPSAVYRRSLRDSTMVLA